MMTYLYKKRVMLHDVMIYDKKPSQLYAKLMGTTHN